MISLEFGGEYVHLKDRNLSGDMSSKICQGKSLRSSKSTIINQFFSVENLLRIFAFWRQNGLSPLRSSSSRRTEIAIISRCCPEEQSLTQLYLGKRPGPDYFPRSVLLLLFGHQDTSVNASPTSDEPFRAPIPLSNCLHHLTPETIGNGLGQLFFVPSNYKA